jgi:hypothetical protein
LIQGFLGAGQGLKSSIIPLDSRYRWKLNNRSDKKEKIRLLSFPYFSAKNVFVSSPINLRKAGLFTARKREKGSSIFKVLT